ncbi:low molecular weight phosphatase family protein [Aureivirga marina]|uniref:hypothetical protein n=1 Tax=Aureivirga marina TaxID=1182451 RepID=UPI0018C90E59|nr:hypothetical protein [Aureivirga marina]
MKVNTENFFRISQNDIEITNDRKETLNDIAKAVLDEYLRNERVNLNFICSHNSRRSQFAQIWGNYAINFFSIPNMECFSGGTVVTALHRNTVKTLKEVGFRFDVKTFNHQNPEYLISYQDCKKPILAYSKLIEDQNNKSPYIAITTCNSIEKNCPLFTDCLAYFQLPYTDPKNYDYTALKNEKYNELNMNIASEMAFLFGYIASKIKSYQLL